MDTQEIKKQTEWMRLLYEITSQESDNLERQLERALELTADMLNLEVGIISYIEDGTYRVEYFYPAESELEQGQEFRLGDTYCSITLEEDSVVAIDKMKGSQYERHPCYNVFHLESYIGIPLHVDHELYGTLNFSSPEVRKQGFTDLDKRFIRLLGEWAEAIIKRKQIEDKNREQHKNIEAILENTDSLIWSVDEDYCLLTFNSSYSGAVARTTGQAPHNGESVLGHEATEEEKEKWKERYDAVLASGESMSFTDRVSLEQGAVVFGVFLYPIKDENSDVTGVSGFAKDITQTEQLEKQINKFFELSLDLMAIAEFNGYFRQVNPAFANTLGFSQEEMTSRPAMKFVHPDDVEQSKEVTARLAKGEQTVNYTNRCLCKDGSYKWISWKAEADLASGLIYATGRDVTYEKEKREELKFREERYGLAIEGASAGIWDWVDVNENKQWWSPVFYELLGYENQEIEASLESFKALLHPDDQERTFNLVEEHFRSGEPFDIEYRLKTKSGEYRWYAGSGQADFDEEGNPVRMVGTITDINERKEVEVKLKKSRELYKLISENSVDLVCLHAADGTYEYVSPSATVLLGYQPENMVGKNPYDFFHPDDLKKIREKSHQKAKSGKQVQNFQYRFRKKNGEYIWFETSTEPIENEEGEVVKLRTASRDISKRKNLELLLKETNRLASVGGWEYDLETGDLFWTNEVYEIHELPVGTEVKVEEGLTYYPPEAQLVIEKAIEKAVETGEGWDVELPFITAKNNKKWVRAIGRVHEQDGNVYKISGTFQDLTARKSMEDELVKAKEQADAANKAKSQFIANMSHEIRTPMNAILGFAELLKGKVEGGTEKNYVENIYSSGKNLLSLINDILDLSKIESGKEEVQLQAVSVSRLIREMGDLFSLKAEQKGIEIKTKVEDDIPESLLLDEVRLRQILLNLTGNATKFTSSGYVEITASARYQDENESMVDITFNVRDTGIGIKADKLDTIFQEFEQQDYSISQQYGGTGLGLAICKKLVGMMNGEITVESTEAEGSTFSVFIPDVTIASVVEESRAQKMTSGDYKLKPARVLVVDDLSINRQLVSEYLNNQPLELLQAATGQEAIDKVRSDKPDLVLMDIKMPGMSGVEAMQRIKEQGDTTVVALTASGFKGYAQKSEEMGFDAYLRKPVTRQELVRELAKFIGVDVSSELSPVPVSDDISPDFQLDRIEDMDRENLEDLLSALKNEVYPAYENIDRDAMVMSQYEAFADLLQQVGEKYELQQLVAVSDKLDSYAKLFDVEQVDHEMNTLQSRLDHLQTLITEALNNHQ